MNKTKMIISVLLGCLLCTQQLFAAFRDPTSPPAEFLSQSAESPSLFNLDAILIAKDRKFAVINGIDKRMGDEILGEHVVAIDDNTVQLQGPSGRITLFLLGRPIKQFPNGKREGNPCMDASKGHCYY